MKNIVIYDMHHIQNNITRLIRTIDENTAGGLETLTALASIRSQISNVTDSVKAI